MLEADENSENETDSFEFDDLSDEDFHVSVLSEQVAALEEQLSDEKDRRQEDRFIGLVGGLMFLDIILLKDAQNFVLPIIVLVLQLVILLILAKRMGAENLVRIIDGLIHSWSRPWKGGDD